jgi:hypothetical protein
MKIFIFSFFLLFLIKNCESRPREGFIWPNATLWTNVTAQNIKRADTAVDQGNFVNIIFLNNNV